MDIKHCEICHSNYVPALPEDIIFHRKYHDQFVNGVKVSILKSDNVIFNSGEFKIIVVSPKSSLQQRKRAETIALRAKRDTDFDFASYHSDETKEKDSPLVFIGIIKNRAIAMLVFRKTQKTAKVTWELYQSKDRENIPLLTDVRWKIAMIWILENKRRKGYARQLINIAAEYVGNSVSEIAWSTPFTELGYPLAQTIAPNEVILTG
jgi:hypothetical protein